MVRPKLCKMDKGGTTEYGERGWKEICLQEMWFGVHSNPWWEGRASLLRTENGDKEVATLGAREYGTAW